MFESFNARALDPAQVALRFVPSEHFEALLKRRNTLVIGPRGSGKTTLLKMLQQPALEVWAHPLADSYRARIDFTGIFVATDVSWREQLKGFDELRGSGSAQVFSRSTFVTHVLKSVVSSLENRTTKQESAVAFRRVKLASDAERGLIAAIAKAWHLGPVLPTWIALRQALTLRLLEIHEIAGQELLRGEAGRAERLAGHKFLHLDFLQAAGVAVEAFDDAIDQRHARWAFLFDELELAPEWVQAQLETYLRSTNDKFLFKLALSPFSAASTLMQTAESASAGQDFDQIALWYAEKNNSARFCTDLWYQLLEERGVDLSTEEALDRYHPSKVLGDSYFGTYSSLRRGTKTAYESNSKVIQRFKDLAAKDASFAKYLRNKDIDLHRVSQLSESKKAAQIRKISPLVAIREFYRRDDIMVMTPGAERSRKTATLYAGAESLFAITEGIPRWFIAICERLLEDWSPEVNRRIDPAKQASEVSDAADRFNAMLATIPVSLNRQESLSLYEVVAKAAEFFHDAVVKGPFRTDPPGTFIVDARVPDELVRSLGQALNAGAIVYVPDEQHLVLKTLRKRRFRLSYMLAPIYGLPLRLGQAVALSTILLSGSRVENVDVSAQQLDFLKGQQC